MRKCICGGSKKMKNKFIVTVIMLLITTTCFGFVESYEENKIDKQVNSNYDYYNQATVIIFGSCDSAYVVGFSWRFGLYIPKVRRTIHIDLTISFNNCSIIVKA